MLEKLKKLKLNIGWKSLILIGVCVVLVLIDLLTKIFEERDNWNFTVIPKFIEVASGSRNPGCAFSFLAEAAWGQTFLIVVTFIMLAVLIAVFTVLPERFILLKRSEEHTSELQSLHWHKYVWQYGVVQLCGLLDSFRYNSCNNRYFVYKRMGINSPYKTGKSGAGKKE